MRTKLTLTRNPRRLRFLPAALIVVCSLWGGAIVFTPEARAQAMAGPFRGNYAGYYYSPGGYSGAYYFNPGYYANPAPAVAVAPARGYTVARPFRPGRHVYVNHEDWSSGRTNYPIPLMKPWMMPLRYSVPN